MKKTKITENSPTFALTWFSPFLASREPRIDLKKANRSINTRKVSLAKPAGPRITYCTLADFRRYLNRSVGHFTGFSSPQAHPSTPKGKRIFCSPRQSGSKVWRSEFLRLAAFVVRAVRRACYSKYRWGSRFDPEVYIQGARSAPS